MCSTYFLDSYVVQLTNAVFQMYVIISNNKNIYRNVWVNLMLTEFNLQQLHWHGKYRVVIVIRSIHVIDSNFVFQEPRHIHKTYHSHTRTWPGSARLPTGKGEAPWRGMDKVQYLFRGSIIIFFYPKGMSYSEEKKHLNSPNWA